MSVIIYIGDPGSGKTACAVREMAIAQHDRMTYTNIETKHIPKIKLIEPSMIVDKEYIQPKSGKGKPRLKLSCNVGYWQEARREHKVLNIILDEAHTLMNSRRGMSNLNRVMLDFLALIRRMVGTSDSGSGDLILITQRFEGIDKVARDFTTKIVKHVCYYHKTCPRCKQTWVENNETSDKVIMCPLCARRGFKSEVKKHTHWIMRYHFRNEAQYMQYRDFNLKTYYKASIVDDIEKYFSSYDTLQLSALISDDYEE